MKNILYKLSVVLFSAVLMFSCEENDYATIDATNGPTLAQFTTTDVVLPTPEEGASTEVEVTVTTKSSTERVINVQVDPSSTATPGQYTLSNLVIPANSFTGYITITSNFDALPETETAILVLNLTDIGGNSDTLLDNEILTVELFRKCAIVLEDFVGTWSGSGSWSSALGYETEVVTFLNEDGELMINGLAFQWFKGWWGEVIVTNEAVKMDVDLETGAITIPEQFYITATYNGAPQPTYNLRGSGMILNSCTKTMEIRPVFIQGGSAINGTAWGPEFVERIRLNASEE